MSKTPYIETSSKELFREITGTTSPDRKNTAIKTGLQDIAPTITIADTSHADEILNKILSTPTFNKYIDEKAYVEKKRAENNKTENVADKGINNVISTPLPRDPTQPYIPRILIAAPQHDSKRYCFEEWYMAVKSIIYDKAKVDVLLVDNSSNDTFSKYMQAYDINIGRINVKGKNVMQRMAESHEMCRVIALEEGYDFLLHIETDVIPPPDIIHKLLLARKKVVSALYAINNGAQRELCVRFKDYCEPLDAVFIYGNNYNSTIAGKGLTKVFNAGLGCTLIHRSVLSQFKFRVASEDRFSDSHPDTWFAYDLMSKNIPIYCDTNTICRHLNASNWHSKIPKKFK